MASATDNRLRVFCSFSYSDEKYMRELRTRLGELERQGLIEVWTDREIPAGQAWDTAIRDALEASDIFLALVSPDYMNSEYAYGTELVSAVRKYRLGETLVIPIIVRPVDWMSSPLANFQALPRDAKPISTWSNEDEAWLDVIKGIRGAVETLSSRPDEQLSREPPGPPASSRGKAAQETGEDEPEGYPRLRRRERMEVAPRALSDKWSKKDQLDFLDYATALSLFIENPRTDKPLTISIDAPWGMGKTTLMRMIQSQLQGNQQQEKATVKTTLVRKMISRLRGRPNRVEGNRLQDEALPTVWFNAWQHDEEESVWATLVLDILDQTRKEVGLRERARLWLDLNRKRVDVTRLILRLLGSLLVLFGFLLAVVFVIGLLWAGNILQEVTQWVWQSIVLIGGLGIVATLYNTIVKDVYRRITSPFNLNISQYISAPDYKEKAGFLSLFQEDFRRVVDSITTKTNSTAANDASLPSNGRRPLVIFIDDLDRAAPSKAVEIIEAISVLLDVEHCVFIVGMDSEMVAASIETKYKDVKDHLGYANENDLTLGRSFLEKIIQIPFRIPRADKVVFSTFIKDVLKAEERDAGRDITDRPAEEDSYQDASSQEQSEEAAMKIAGAEREMRAEIIRATSFEDSAEVRQAVLAAARYLEYNPRKLKRFINLFKLQALIANLRGLLENGTIRLDHLAKWLTIRTCWPTIIESTMADLDYPDHLLQAHATQNELQNLTDGPQEAVEARDKLVRLLTYPAVELFYQDTDLIELLQETSHSASNVSPYLHLTMVTAGSAIPAQSNI